VDTEPRDPGGNWTPRLLGLYGWVAALALVTVTARAYRLFDIGTLWDDAYIFQRYAAHLGAGEGLSWQPGGPPVYGLTSPLYAVPALIGQWATDDVSRAASLPSVVFGVTFMAALGHLLWRFTPGGRHVRAATILLVAVCMATSTTPVHFTTGMDTTFALTYQTLHLMAAAWFAEKPTLGRAVLLGVTGALALWIRPELLAFALLIPAALVLRPPEHAAHRKAALLALGSCAVAIAVIALANLSYFGTPLPLPFHAKLMGGYDQGLAKVYKGAALRHLVQFSGHYWPLLTVIAAEVVGRPRQFLRTTGPLVLGSLGGTVVVLAYHTWFALPVMAMSERFLQIAVVPLAYVTGRILATWATALAPLIPSAKLRSLAALVALAFCSLLLWPSLVREVSKASEKMGRGRAPWVLASHARTKGPRSYWYRLDGFTALPADAVIATSEVGMIGVLHPKRHIIDLAGLNEPRFALGGFDAELLLAEMKPDLIYMPHKDYGSTTQAILTSPHFAGYEHYDKRRTGTRTFGIAIRRDSMHYDMIHRIAGLKQRTAPPPRSRKR
jgi:hypothetical protein